MGVQIVGSAAVELVSLTYLAAYNQPDRQRPKRSRIQPTVFNKWDSSAMVCPLEAIFSSREPLESLFSPIASQPWDERLQQPSLGRNLMPESYRKNGVGEM